MINKAVIKLKKREDIRNLLKFGKKSNSNNLSLKFLQNNLEFSRFLILPSKKIKGVKRNLVRRRLSEILRLNNFKLKQGYDCAFFLKDEVMLLSYYQLQDETLLLLEQASLVNI